MDYIQDIRDHFCYEPLTGDLFWTKRPSNRVKLFDRAGSKSPLGYIVGCLKRKQFLAHRIIFEMLLGRKLTYEENVDHINGDKSDNRLENLRLVDSATNARAFRTKAKGKASEFRGVRFDNERNSWRAVISANGKTYSKRKKTEVEAALAYDEMATNLGWPNECKNFKEGSMLSDLVD